MGPLEIWSCPLPPADRQEILRYAGAGQADPLLHSLLEEALGEAAPILAPKLCFRTVPVRISGNTVHFDSVSVSSRSLADTLSGCTRAVVFAATVGIALDRKIARYGRTAPARALLLQAIGTERIEAFCDCFCRALEERSAAERLHPTRRFSPGYGDLPLTFQRDLFRLLDCPRAIGLSLNESLLMSPSKSVTALVGLGGNCQDPSGPGCTHCTKSDCIYRRS